MSSKKQSSCKLLLFPRREETVDCLTVTDGSAEEISWRMDNRITIIVDCLQSNNLEMAPHKTKAIIRNHDIYFDTNLGMLGCIKKIAKKTEFMLVPLANWLATRQSRRLMLMQYCECQLSTRNTGRC